MSVPSNTDFAAEVRSDRLATLWKGMLILGGLLAWISLSLSIVQDWRDGRGAWVVTSFVMIAGALLTRFFLRRDNYNAALAFFMTGSMIAVLIPSLLGDDSARQVMPFVFPVLVFLFGLLSSPAVTVAVAFLASLLIFGSAALTLGVANIINGYSFAAVALIALAVVLSSQVTGEIYQVTEWALSNYERERRTNHELFEKRQELQLALKRAQVLGEDLQEANVELESARKAAEEAKHFRGQFLANMSHELRTPLNAIIGFSETMLNFPMMYEDVRLPSQYEADLRQIFTSGKSLLHLINDILDLAKVDAGKLEVVMQPVELEAIIRGVMSTAQGLIGAKPVKLERDTPAELPKVWADETRVRQVLLNLYSNAAKFTDSGSIMLRVRETDEGVQFSLTDTGMGVKQEDLGIIFEEFKQSSSSAGRDPRSGAGLGLAISRQLMTLMGGRIWAESEVGKGSTFHFVVQKYQEQQPAAVPMPVQEAKA